MYLLLPSYVCVNCVLLYTQESDKGQEVNHARPWDTTKYIHTLQLKQPN